MNKIFNAVKNINFKVDYNIYDFIIKYKTIILITFFIGIIVNAVDVFTIKFGIDSELHAIENSPQIYFDTQRYGSWLLYYLLPFARYHILSQLIGIFALTLAALLTVSRHNISNNGKLLFMLLFVTFPNFAFLQYFYFQSTYNFIGLLLTVIAYRLIERNHIITYIFAVILLFIGISSYQANAAIFLSVMMINITLDYVDSKNIKQSLSQIIQPVVIIFISLVIYYICMKILNNGLNQYHLNMINKNLNLDRIGNSLTHIWRILSSNGYDGNHTANLSITIIIIVYLINFIKNYHEKKNRIEFLFLIFLFMCSISSLYILIGGAIMIRLNLSFALYPAFIILLIYILNNQKIIKNLSIVLSILIIVYHSSYIVKFQTSYYLIYKQDEVLAKDIISKIYNKYPDIFYSKYNINFIGRLTNLKQHPLINGKDMFNVSVFSAHSDHIKTLAFLKLIGFPMDVKLGKITDNMINEIKNMPSYPNNDCIQLFDNTVIVKLSD